MVEIIDRTRYLIIPKTTGRRLLSLGRLLVKYVPETQSIDVSETFELLTDEIGTVSQAYADRHRESGPAVAAEDGDLDGTVDTLLHTGHRRLKHYEVFERPTIVRLAEIQKPGGFDYRAQIEKAKLAKRADALLFGKGLEYTKGRYVDQAEHMRVLQTLIAQEQLEPVLDQLIGAGFVGALADLHHKYLEMVERRAIRTQGSAINLREHAARLQRAILNYVIAVLAMIRDNDDQLGAQIKVALRPIDALREQLNRERSRGDSSSTEVVDEEDAEVIDELVAEQQAVDAELGLPSDPSNSDDVTL